mmetsp:Transcript_10557/g.36724  ORF Transcript_10557/g.36724 Transcript_10557/m.36724 type:complete len:134 (+) Transcript_10557:147-548(+)|eukprot:CAMPEP_0183797406 /NCGR_PEP_ID=MMETSP0803_2-20130417/15664_1 /TAXON_ID=195967 /ORGANISM="Crustomastix stigmata, Strain CCMP3273" /LENGTH=133 /DNA_ID=CAMNT_0026042075 /DNA_START=69 /DNA_END=470 /DNA_ORIENTATION=-
MSYNLYQVQQAAAWTERIQKEQMIAERFTAERTREAAAKKKKASALDKIGAYGSAPPTEAGRSGVSRRTGATAVMKERLALLEEQLESERAERKAVQLKLERLAKVAGIDVEEDEEGEAEALAEAEAATEAEA